MRRRAGRLKRNVRRKHNRRTLASIAWQAVLSLRHLSARNFAISRPTELPPDRETEDVPGVERQTVHAAQCAADEIARDYCQDSPA
jgi:hypothetical protein